MAVNTLQTRVGQKYDTFANWAAANPVLLLGEIAVVEIPVTQTGTGMTPPAIALKVGDGVSAFNTLPWIQSTAGDVHTWAKSVTKPTYDASEIENLDTEIADIIASENLDTNTTYTIAATSNEAGASLDMTAGGSGSGKQTIEIVGTGGVTVSVVDGKVQVHGAAQGSGTVSGNYLTEVSLSNGVLTGVAKTAIANIAGNSTSTDLPTTKAVFDYVEQVKATLQEEMAGGITLQGTVGTGGDVEALPGTASKGDLYIVIEDGTYAGVQAKVGDQFIANADNPTDSDWIHVPVASSGGGGTVTSVTVAAGIGLLGGGTITSSGTITLNHQDKPTTGTAMGNTGRTYVQDIELDQFGHIVSISTATETVTNTDHYVDEAAFTSDATGIELTLTRAGSDTAEIKAKTINVNAAILNQTSGDLLILNCGNSTTNM